MKKVHPVSVNKLKDAAAVSHAIRMGSKGPGGTATEQLKELRIWRAAKLAESALDALLRAIEPYTE